MKKINITKEQVGNAIKGTGKVVICGLSCLALIAPYVERSVNVVKSCLVKADYSGAISTILNSDMLSSYKKEAIALVEKGKDVEYYKSIIDIVNSSMLSSYKIDLIKTICED